MKARPHDLPKQMLRLAAYALAAGLLFTSAAQAQLLYHSPEEATAALIAAARSDDDAKLLAILGPGGRDIIESGDPVADNAQREKFVAAYDAKHQITPDSQFKATLVIGDKDWPFPIPITKKKGMWRFNTPAGRQEILYRRVGQNEADAIEVALAYVDTQKEYAADDPDKTGLHPYAEKIVSSPDKKDGLYWPSQPGEKESPIGEFMADASSQGYTPGAGAPYHGYRYKILTAQGPAAPGGAYDYIVRGKMIGGFGLVAYPADYGNSGVMTFIVNQDGEVYQKDLGPRTETLAPKIDSFNPDKTWKAATPVPEAETGGN